MDTQNTEAAQTSDVQQPAVNSGAETPAADMNNAGTDTSDGLANAVDIGWLDLAKAEFYAGAGGFTGLRYGDADYKRIQLRRAMPVRHPSEYISVADHENKEIGMLRALADLADGQLRIVSDELDRRYYCPEIKSVKSVRDKLGYVYMELVVFAGGETHERSAAVNDIQVGRIRESPRLSLG